MTPLESWLKQATRCLSSRAAEQVQREIREHYEATREEALGSGVSDGEASRMAVAALGDAREANRRYRKALLTAAEEKLLKTGNWEAHVVCATPWLKWLLMAAPAAALVAAAGFLLRGDVALARALLAGGIAMALVFAAPFLPIYTPWRARVFRAAKWTALMATFWLAFGPEPLKWLWLMSVCVWPVLWIEWSRISIRRKLPMGQWPKQLYF